MGAAIAASLLVHGLLLFALPIDSPWPGVDLHPGDAAITVRIAPPPVLASDASVSPEPGPIFPRSGAETPALAPAPDPHYYLAQELDSYPRPLLPLRLGRLAGSGAGEIRLEILIDEQGVVQDVIFARTARPDPADEKLRTLLAETPFLPARKDGRVVKSRVMLRVSFSPEDGKR